MRQGPSEAKRGQGRCRESTGPGAPEAAPRPGFSPAPEAGRCSGGRRVERCCRGSLGEGKGQFQKLTAKAKTPVLSPSEVHVLCTGQLPSTLRSLSRAGFAVLLKYKIVFHMVIAALWSQSSVSEWSQTQNCGLSTAGGTELAASSASAHCPSPGIPALWGREGAWQLARGLTCQGWEREQPEGPGTLCWSDTWNRLHGYGLVSPEPSGQVGPIPVTRWGHTQESHHHICGLCLCEIQQCPFQPVLSRLIGQEPLVDVPHHGRNLKKAQGDLGSCQRQ